MSHFTCAVAVHPHQDLDSLLEPFSEENVDGIYSDFEDQTESLKEAWDANEEEYPNPYKEGCKKRPIQSMYKTFEDYANSVSGFCESKENPGQFGYYYNSNAKWDWWQIGGRWQGGLILKKDIKHPEDIDLGQPGICVSPEAAVAGRCSAARVVDIDFDAMYQERLDEIKEGYKTIEEYRNNPTEDLKRTVSYMLHGTPYSLDNLPPSCDDWVKIGSKTIFYDYLIDDEWGGQGEAGWWGVEIESYANAYENEKKFIAELKPDDMLYLVDCHI